MAYIPFNKAAFVGPFVVKEGDTENKITVRLMDASGNPEDLGTATVTWSLAKFDGGLVIANRPVEKLTNGQVRFGFTPEDVTGFGAALLQFKVDRGTTVEMFPADASLILYITADSDNLAHTPVNYATLGMVEQRFQTMFDNFTGEVQEGSPGVGLTFAWNGTQLGVKREDEQDFVYQDLRGPAGGPGIQGEPGEPGPPGTGIEILGALDNTGQLPASGTTGDAYLVNQNLWVWGGTAWEDAGTIQGPQGQPGIDGSDGLNGKSIEFAWNGYQLGVRQEGGTYQYTNLRGAQGLPGSDGSDGLNGNDGADGKNLEFTWDGSQLGVRQQGQTVYNYSELRGPQGLPGEKGEPGEAGRVVGDQWKGGNVSVFGSRTLADVLADAEKLDLTTVTVPVLVDAPTVTTSAPTMDAGDWAAAQALAIGVRDAGYNVIIEPFPYVANGTVIETEWNPDDMALWFQTYGAILEQVATFCEAEDMTAMYIASNLVYMEPEVARWTTLINTLRGIFNGNIVYRTNWWWQTPDFTPKLTNAIFGLVDIIAIAAYFEVSDEPDPTIEQLKAGLRSSTVWDRGQDIYGEIEQLALAHGKQIYFGELGICPYHTAPSQPWAYQFDPQVTPYDEGVQVNWFTAWHEVFKDAPWFKGYSVFAIADAASEYNPAGKEAEATLKNLYLSTRGLRGEKGEPGEPGPAGVGLEFTWNGYQLGVRQEGGAYSYTNLRGAQGLPGSDGLDGSDGRDLEFSWTGTQLGVRVAGTSTYSYTDLVGPAGSPGTNGSDGSDGVNGKNLEFLWSGTQLGVRQQGQATYTYTDLRGPQGLPGSDGSDGEPGTPGVDGKSLEFLWNGTQLGVRQQGGTYTYTNLKGDKGDKGDPGTPGSDGADANLFIEPRTSDPASPQIGQIWLRTDL